VLGEGKGNTSKGRFDTRDIASKAEKLQHSLKRPRKKNKRKDATSPVPRDMKGSLDGGRGKNFST